MKVLQINTTYSYSSPARIMLDLYNVLESEGHECCIAYGRGNRVEGYKSIKIGSALNVKIHGIITRIFDLHGRASILATIQFVKNVKRYKPDLIHMHNIHGYYININVLFQMLEQLNIPVIWTLHDCWAYTGHCAYYDFAGCNKWRTECHRCPQLNKYPVSFWLDNSRYNFLNKKDLYKKGLNITLVTPSEWLANQVKQSILKDFRIQVINNGIDLGVFKPSKSDYFKKEKNEGKKIILGVANVWEDRKGFKRFIELSEVLDEQFLIVMVGVSKKQKEIMPHNIWGIERLEDIHELALIYSSADIYINLSVEETMGLTTIEAMACGTQSIVLNSTAIPEFVAEECGKILDKNSTIFEIKTQLLKMTENPIYPERCVQEAKKYNKEKKYREYLDLYEYMYSYGQSK